jgi:hypothetical protein
MSALVTEHFVLQSVSSATISESGSRVSIYLSSLSSGLVAIGFASSSPHALAALAFTVLPVLAPSYFEADDSAAGVHGVRYGRWSFLFTMASLVVPVHDGEHGHRGQQRARRGHGCPAVRRRVHDPAGRRRRRWGGGRGGAAHARAAVRASAA